MRAAFFLIGLLMISLTAGKGWTLPTEPKRKLVWEHPGAEDLAGFRLYWAKQSEPEPRLYDDTRRVQIDNINIREIVVIDAKPDATGGLCFKLTAFDSSNNESGFSNEACGWLGLESPLNLRPQ